MAALCTVTAATQPALMRFGATRLHPMLFAAGCAVVATLCVLPVVYVRGELSLLVDRRYRIRLLTLSIIGTVVTTLTLVFGLRHIDAVAGTLLLQSEPVYSLMLATLFLGERPTLRQLAATSARRAAPIRRRGRRCWLRARRCSGRPRTYCRCR